MALFEIKGVSFSYPERERPALKDVSLSVGAGEFAVLCGKSGCGKSTLLRHLKTVLTPFGKRAGEVRFDGRLLSDVPQREQASRIGFVLQSPDNQIVTDKVWHELAFGLESLGEKTPVIRRRVAEMASFFGIQEWYEKSVAELSGGQKQLLALAAALAMQPDVLILDEPTAQLDPIAAEDFICTLKKINDEIGTTIILSEHRLEGALPRADRAVVMGGGEILCEGGASDVAHILKEKADPMLTAMPTPMRVYLALESAAAGHVPQTVREGRLYLQGVSGGRPPDTPDARGLSIGRRVTAALRDEAHPLIELKDVWFRYEREGRDIVKDLALRVCPGELVCVAGGNGTGKSTMLGVVTGENKYYRGRARTLGLDPKKAGGRALTDAGLAALPQDPQTLFTRATVFDNLIETAAACAKRRGEKPVPENIEADVRRVCALTDTADLMGFHPYDVSGGEQQRTGLAMALLTRPKLLLLDEPTKGMDSFFKEKFAAILGDLCAEGMGVLMVSHDVEFCAKYADRCALFFGGGIVSEGEPRAFFSGNSFYTTAANRMSRGIIENAVTAEEVIECVKLYIS
ncbi:MAG: ATP-binding cassette domain-containing protein [Clostridiales Family XIII bacterium]|jgi:energy-coupling factor transport system ATP-binding protein|nr:ATP-binding cassette domain-containing protein [Clostridiales Family XIII bacterium]